MIHAYLLAASALVILGLGAAHLWFGAPFGGILLASALYLAGLIAQASGA